MAAKVEGSHIAGAQYFRIEGSENVVVVGRSLNRLGPADKLCLKVASGIRRTLAGAGGCNELCDERVSALTGP